MNKHEEALAVLRRAMENEREGYRFYLEASERSADPAGQGTFRSLARDEEHNTDSHGLHGREWNTTPSALARDG